MTLPSDTGSSDGPVSNEQNDRSSGSTFLERLEKAYHAEVQRRYAAERKAAENAFAYKEIYDRLIDYERMNDEERTRVSQLEAQVRRLQGELSNETERANANEWNIRKAEEEISEMQGTAQAHRDKWKAKVEELEVNLQQERDTSAKLRELMKGAAADVRTYKNEVMRFLDGGSHLQDNMNELATLLQEKKHQLLHDRKRLEQFLDATESTVSRKTHALHDDFERRRSNQEGAGKETLYATSTTPGPVNGLEFPFGRVAVEAAKVRSERPRLNPLEERRYIHKPPPSSSRTHTSSPEPFYPINDSPPLSPLNDQLFSPFFNQSPVPFNAHLRSHSESPPPDLLWDSHQPFNPNQRPLYLELASEGISDLEHTSTFNTPNPPASLLKEPSLSDTDTELEDMSSQTSLGHQWSKNIPEWTMQDPTPLLPRKRLRFSDPTVTDADYSSQPETRPQLAQLAAGGSSTDVIPSVEPEELPSPPKHPKTAEPQQPVLRTFKKIDEWRAEREYELELESIREYHHSRRHERVPTPPEPTPPPPEIEENKPIIQRYLTCPGTCPCHDEAPWQIPTVPTDPVLELAPSHYLRQKYACPPTPVPEPGSTPTQAAQELKTLPPPTLTSSSKSNRSGTKQKQKQKQKQRVSKKRSTKSRPKIPGSWPRESKHDRELTVDLDAMELLQKARNKSKQWLRSNIEDFYPEMMGGAYLLITIFGDYILRRLEQAWTSSSTLTPETLEELNLLHARDEITWFGLMLFDVMKTLGMDRVTYG